MASIRTFIAIEIPSNIQRKIEVFQSILRDIKPRGISWVKVKNIHLTLKFLGDVERSQIDAINSAVAKACEEQPAFSISVDETGFFPNHQRPRVIWIGCRDKEKQLVKLHSLIDIELAKLGFEKENRQFSPHLTIGRVKDNQGLSRVVQVVNASHFSGGLFQVQKILVLRSQLHPTGSIYTPLGEIDLK